MGWLLFAAAILITSGIIGLHLGRFREAYTEMTGMMAGMTMGMLNGFLLGYAGAAATTSLFAGTFLATATGSLFWGNLSGMLLGGLMGVYFGRAGGLMGMMDGGMGGVMGGSMGAMLAAMLAFPAGLLFWTAFLLAAVYVVGMVMLVVLIEKSAPGHEALHRLAPYFTRAVEEEVEEAGERQAAGAGGGRQMPNYYDFLEIEWQASEAEITDAYLGKLAAGDEIEMEWAERALAILTDPRKRAAYDRRLKESLGRGDCCPPPKRKKVVATAAAVGAGAETPRETVVAASARTAAPVASAAVSARQSVQTRPARNGNSRGQGGQGQQVRSQRQQQKTATRRNTRQPQRGASASGPLIGAGLGGLLVIALAAVWMLIQGAAPVSGSTANGSAGYTDTGNPLPAEFVSQLEARAVAAPVGSDGKQTLDVSVDAITRGYTPSVIKVKQGTPVHFNLSATNGDPGCGRYVGVRGLGVHGIVEPGSVTAMDFTPDKTGIFQINCGMQMMDPGYLIVTQ